LKFSYATYNPIVLNGSSVDDIYTNEIAPSSAGSFRTDIPEIYSVDLASLQMSDESYRFKLFDVSGRLIQYYEGTCQNMMNVVQSKAVVEAARNNTAAMNFFITLHFSKI
jgi:hypothetical protein